MLCAATWAAVQVPPGLPQAGGTITLTVTLLAAEPPAPLHVRVNVEDWLSAPVDFEPVVGWVPLQAFEALQLEAFAELQDSVDDWPLLTEPGEAESDTVGTGAGVPPPPPPPVPPPPPPEAGGIDGVEVPAGLAEEVLWLDGLSDDALSGAAASWEVVFEDSDGAATAEAGLADAPNLTPPS